MKRWLCFVLSSLLVVTWFVVSADETANRLYGDLLKELVKVNENRMDTIVKLSKPTKFNFAKTIQRTLKNPTQQIDKKDPIVLLVLDLPSEDVEGSDLDALGNIFSQNADYKKHYRSLMSEKIKTQLKNLLRSDWLKACRRDAEKKCQKACKDSVQTVCTFDSCKRNMKKKFIKECKKSCKNEFEPESDSEESGSDECAGRSGCKS